MKFNRYISSAAILALAGCQAGPQPSLAGRAPRIHLEVASRGRTSPSSETLGFGEAALLALRNNPGLMRFNPELRALDGRILQASLKPNPTLDGEIENIGGTGANRGFDAAESTLAVSQVIERGGKPEARRAVRLAEKAILRSDYELARREVFSEVGQAFAQALAAQEEVNLYGELVELNESFLPEIDKRIEAGKVTAVERSRAKTAVTTARLAQLQAKREFRIARLRLAATWGGASPGFARVAGKLGDLPALADEAALKRRLLDHPAYRKEVEGVRKSAADHRLAIANGKQDFTVKGGLRHFRESGDEVALVLGFSMPLPLSDRNQGEIAATREEIKGRESRRAAAYAMLKARLEIALETLAATRGEADTITGELLPLAEESYAGIQEGYSKGRYGYLDFIEARRSLTDAKVQLLAAKSAYQQAAAEIAGLTGALPGDAGNK